MFKVYCRSKANKQWKPYSQPFINLESAEKCKVKCESLRICDVKGNIIEYKVFIERNSVVFEVKNPIEKPMFIIRKGLYACYKNPSIDKKSVYRYWRNYVFDNFYYAENFGIESYNCNTFTLGWTTPEGEFYVTNTRQEFYPYYK